jgi:type VI protein secretion system component VasK
MTTEARILALANGIAADIKQINTNAGDLTTLTTTAKNSLVAALNELKSLVGGINTNIIDDVTAATNRTYSSTKINGLIQDAIDGLVNGAGAALDTLNELATALGNDADFSTTIMNMLGKRVRVDAAQTFTVPEQTQGRANIGAAEKSVLDQLLLDLGGLDTDFVAAYNLAKV